MLCVSSGLSTADGDAGKDMMEDLVSLEEIQMRANAIPSSPSPSSRFQERPRASSEVGVAKVACAGAARRRVGGALIVYCLLVELG